MASFFRGSSSSKKAAAKDKGKKSMGATECERAVNLVDDIGCYDLGEYRAGDYEYSQDEYPPCPPGFENLTPQYGQDRTEEADNPEVEEIPAEEMEDYVGVEEGLEQQPTAERSGLPPRPYKSNIFVTHFRKVPTADGTLRAHCNYCTASYAWKKGDGYGSLTKHLKSKHPSEYGMDRTQTQISKDSMEKRGKPFKYTDDKYQEGLNMMICGLNLGFNAGENKELQYCHEQTLNPQARRWSARAMTRFCQSSYRKRKLELKGMFYSLDTFVSICSDIWTDSWRENSYMGVTAHWIDNNWVLNKRLIALRKMDGAHTANNIYRTLCTIMDEYMLTKKIFSVGFDNAAANTASINELQELCQPALGGTFFHIRCACHILNLCVKDGIDSLNIRSSPIKQAIDHIIDRPSIGKEWRKWCNVHGKRPKKFRKDVPHRWNSTYLLLQSTVEYKELLCSFAIAHLPDIPLHISEWNVCRDLLNLLKVFYDCTNTFSRVYSPSVHLFILEAGNIIGTMLNVRSNPFLQVCVNDMVRKWLKYYREIPMIYNIAWILDPRNKLEGLKDHLEYYYQCIDKMSDTQDMYSISATSVVEQACAVLSEMYSQFMIIYGGQIPASPSTPVNPQSEDLQEFVPPALYLQKRRLKKHRGGTGTSGSTHSEMEKYFNTEFEFGDDVDAYNFDILDWWKHHSQTYPILSRIARQVLAAPASTVAVEQAFSIAGNQLDDRKSRRSAVTVEAVACSFDWNRAEMRAQDIKEVTSSDDDFFSDYNSSGGSTAASTPDHVPSDR